MIVKVTQEHIDKARKLIPNTAYVCTVCPVALALKDTFKVETVWASLSKLRIGRFPENIIFEVETPVNIVNWMTNFDTGDVNVQPFEFELSLEGVKL